MKTFVFSPRILALALPTFAGLACAAPLPQPPTFSSTPWELPSLELKQAPSPLPPPYTAAILKKLPQFRGSRSRSGIDHMPIAAPKPGIDFKLIVKAPDPKIDYKMLLSETDSRHAPKP